MAEKTWQYSLYCVCDTVWLLRLKPRPTTMNEVVVIESDDSEKSVVEVEVTRKPTPPLIYIEDEEIILNICQRNEETVLAKDFIINDQELSVMLLEPKSPDVIGSPTHWTPDMIKFYDDDWGDEDQFIVENLQRKMDKTPSLWEISKRDKSQTKNQLRKYIKCWNCGARGHTVTVCPYPPQTPKCHMCGTQGHFEYSCPNAKCLNCGSFSKNYVPCCIKCRKQTNELCSRCRIIGHNFINCPDHWRLFHLTTSTTKVIIPDKNIYKPDKDMWCCNCGKKGHYQAHCMMRKNCGAFQDSLPFVISYQRAFRDIYSGSKKNDVSRKKDKKNNGNRSEKLLKINPINKPIRRKKVQRKKNLKRQKKRKKNQHNAWNGLQDVLF